MSLLIFRVVTGVIAVLAVTAIESQLLSHLFGHVIAVLSAASGS